MKCPHCLVAIHSQRGWKEEFTEKIDKGTSHLDYIGPNDQNGRFWWSETAVCPNCEGIIIWLVSSESTKSVESDYWPGERTEQKTLVWPRHTGRSPVPPEVPDEFSKDYKEACLIFADSTNASAALSRRCLQHILNEKAGVINRDNLANAIGEVINDPSVPSDISGALDDVRNIGNFAAHPNKSTGTGYIIDVEDGEAEWCLEVIEVLFDFYFVKPEDVKRRRAAFDQKLADAGKSPIQRT